MAELERRNGKIKSVKFEIEDDYLRLNLMVEGNGWAVNVTSPAFVYTSDEKEICNSEATVGLYKLMKFFEVYRLEDLKGKVVTCEFRNYNIFNKFIDIIDDEKEFKW